MKKEMTLGMIALCMFFTPLTAQTSRTDSPRGKSNTLDRVISQNYINIRDLKTPMLNFGGGQKQFDRMLEGFSAAFAKYLSEKFEEASALFEENDKEIMDAAMQIAKKYQKDTDALYSLIVTASVRDRMGKSINRRNVEIEMDLTTPNDFYLQTAAHLMKIADQRITEKNPVEAIFYYRKSKQYIFQSFSETGIKPDGKYDRDVADMHGEIYAEAENKKEKDK